MIPKKYLLKDGSVHWQSLYFALVPIWMTKYGPPFGGYNYAFYLYQPHKYFIELFGQAKWFVQRGYRGYSDRDVWSIDSFLTCVLPPMLRQLAKTSHGYPFGCSRQGWSKKLEEMARTFEIAERIQDYDKDSRKLQPIFRRRMRTFVRYFFNLWD